MRTEKRVSGDYVVLLHGLGRTRRSMRVLARRLTQRGFRVQNIGYPSRSRSIEGSSKLVWQQLRQRCIESGLRIHFVTHSMGAIILRYGLAHFGLPALGRTVMLGPPNQGSEIADHLQDSFLYRRFLGPASLQLGTSPESLPNQLGPVDFEVGVIAGNRGNRSLPPLPASLFRGEHDGKVSIERAAVEGMHELIVLPCGHTFIMRNAAVIDQVIHFIERGEFKRSVESRPPSA